MTTTKTQAWTWMGATASTLLLASALTACSSGGSGNSPGEAAEAAADTAEGDAAGKQTVTVSVFTEDRFLEEAAARFEQAHPDIDIEVRETVPTDTSGKNTIRIAGKDNGPAEEDIDKYVNAVGTALMSGKAADLISTNYLPVDRYLDKGMFADWTGIAGKDKDFNADAYYERVLKGLTSGKTWYAIPVGYSLDVLVGNKAAIKQAGGVDDKTWTWEQFIALCGQIASRTNADGTKPQVLGGMKPEELLGYLTKTVYDQLVTKEGKAASFDEKAFRGYLEQVKQLYDSGAVSDANLGRMQQVFMPMSMSAPMELAILPSMLGEGEGEVLQPPGSGKDEGLPFTSDLALALNDRSKVKPAAWEFVKFLLSEEMQASPAMMAFPVNQAAARTKLERFAEQQKSGGAKMMIKNKNGGEKQLMMTQEQIDSALKLLPSVGNYEGKDEKVLGIIKEESAAFFAGSKSAEAVAKAAANRITTYLNE
ncbi:ABC transporter substrate-binding protein [Paenibacillus sacheonensis]|uniref:Extracellular solute-binding protein n=1 Tax=Paenibacillus sacheonensis TaxID=742054 RepID=A0A7X5BUS4_9BACL|nr:extracellular solute-binding protein [Paenibacillus sacheonensis]MBM7563977.1 multiple sugar transport system substrate-binding protein [Paenibacillus sacheonensis]NBC67683.1 extracellular solute-binding protein [Paenibacillus sacheonensis]